MKKDIFNYLAPDMISIQFEQKQSLMAASNGYEIQDFEDEGDLFNF